MYAQEPEESDAQDTESGGQTERKPQRLLPRMAEKEQTDKKEEAQGHRLLGEDTIMNRMAQWQYSKEQKDELHKMIAMGMPKDTILAVFYPETDVLKMRELRRTFRAVHHSAG